MNSTSIAALYYERPFVEATCAGILEPFSPQCEVNFMSDSHTLDCLMQC